MFLSNVAEVYPEAGAGTGELPRRYSLNNTVAVDISEFDNAFISVTYIYSRMLNISYCVTIHSPSEPL